MTTQPPTSAAMRAAQEIVSAIRRAFDDDHSDADMETWVIDVAACIDRHLPVSEQGRDGVRVAINACKDVTTLGRFAASVDPVRWVAQLQAHLESLLTATLPPAGDSAGDAATEYREGDLEKFFGIDPDFTGDLSTEEHLDAIRGEGPTGCLDNNDELSRALRQITPERLNQILKEELGTNAANAPAEPAPSSGDAARQAALMRQAALVRREKDAAAATAEVARTAIVGLVREGVQYSDGDGLRDVDSRGLNAIIDLIERTSIEELMKEK